MIQQSLWKRNPLLFVIPMKLVDDHQGTTHAFWDIPTEGRYITKNDDAKFGVTEEYLKECWKVGRNNFCNSLIRRRNTVLDSLEGNLFLNDLENIQ